MDQILRITAIAVVVQMFGKVSFYFILFVKCVLDVLSSKYILSSLSTFLCRTLYSLLLFPLKLFQIGCRVAPNTFRAPRCSFPSSQRKDFLTIAALKSCGLFSKLITVKLASIRNANATFLSSRDWLSVFTLYYFPSSLLWMCAHPTGRDLTGK